MTKEEIGTLLERVRTWPLERQEDAAKLLLEIERQDKSIYCLSDEERQAIEKSRAQARRGQFAADEEMAALFALYR